MPLSTFLFLCYLTIVLIVNALIPRNHRWIWWLISSYAFCVIFDLRSSLVLLGITLAAYFFGLLISKEQNYKKKKVSLVFGLVISIGSLFFFKYLNFSITIMNDLFTLAGGTFKFDLINLLLPVGLSFYTFQAISYLVDIYNGTIQAEKNLGKFALFLAFFPRLLSGPIERGAHLLPQLSDPVPFEYHRFVSALLRIFWGFFKKLVIADRLSVPVATVFSSPSDFFAPQSIFAAIAFSLQIYIDFSAYCDIAIGAASILGVDLVENFNLPYLAKSVTDFWRRWHMSFSNWLRDYLFIPLNFAVRRKRSRFLKYAIIMVVFLVSGIWHGANYTFILWGLLHGFYQAIEAGTLKMRLGLEKKFSKGITAILFRALQVAVTFALVTFAWIFFRAENTNQAFEVIKNIITFRGSLHGIAWDFLKLGLTPADYWILGFSLLLLLIYEFSNQKQDLLLRSQSWPIPIRWAVYLALIFAVILFKYFGTFTAQDFIYVSF